MNYLCLDHGRIHTGLALATTPLAEPLRTIPTSDVLHQLPNLIDQHHIDRLIIGISENQMAQDTKQFATKLASHIQIPITFHDETLSSHQASKLLRHSSKKTKTGPDHHFAAAIILQDYLDHQS